MRRTWNRVLTFSFSLRDDLVHKLKTKTRPHIVRGPGVTMKTILDILLFPLSLFMEAFVGVLLPVKGPKGHRRRKWALLFLAGCTVAFGMFLLLGLTSPRSPARAVLAGAGLVFMVAFLSVGTARGKEH